MSAGGNEQMPGHPGKKHGMKKVKKVKKKKK